MLAEHRAQRRLRDLRGRDHEVLDLHDRVLRLDDPEVRDGVHPHRHVVLRDHLLRRDVQRDRAQVDLDHPVDDRDQQEEARALRLGQQPAEPEDDAALVLARDLDRRRRGTARARRRRRRGRSSAAVTPGDPTHVEHADPELEAAPSASTRRAARLRAAPSALRACQSSPSDEDEAVAAHDSPAAPTSRCGPTGTGAAPHLRRPSSSRTPRSRRSRAVITTTSGIETWYGAGALWKSMSSPTAERDQPRDGQRAVRDDVRVDRRAARSRAATARAPAHVIGSTEKPKSADQQRDRRRARRAARRPGGRSRSRSRRSRRGRAAR